MEASPEVGQITIDEIFGDVNLKTAEELYKKYRKNPQGDFADILRKEIIEDSIELINYKTQQENDPVYMSYLLEWAIRGFNLRWRLDNEPKSISYAEAVDFVHLDHAILNPEEDTDYELMSESWSKEMYHDAFMTAVGQFGG